MKKTTYYKHINTDWSTLREYPLYYKLVGTHWYQYYENRWDHCCYAPSISQYKNEYQISEEEFFLEFI